jgi:hypothetical protein
MSLSASRRGHHTARQCAPLDAIALACLMLRTRLAAAERRLLRLAESESSETLALGLTYYHNFKAQERSVGAAAAGAASEGRLGVGCLERGSCLLASRPGVGAPLLEL